MGTYQAKVRAEAKTSIKEKTEAEIKPKAISSVITSGFVPQVGIVEMKVYITDGHGVPQVPSTFPNGLIPCSDGWRFKINTYRVDCREALVWNVSEVLRGVSTQYRVAVHPTKLSKGMPKDFMRYPTKAVPYLYMGNFEKHGALFHESPEIMAKWADVFLGILSVILDRNEATERAFREGYLKPGLYESITEGGRGSGCTFQYHSLSSYWSRCPELISLITANLRVAARVCLADYQELKTITAFWNKVSYEEIYDTIQSYNFEKALDIYNKLKECMSYASASRSDPMSWAVNRLDYLEYIIRRGVDAVWPGTDIKANFVGCNGWYTGMGRKKDSCESFFRKVIHDLGKPRISRTSSIELEDIEFMKADSKENNSGT